MSLYQIRITSIGSKIYLLSPLMNSKVFYACASQMIDLITALIAYMQLQFSVNMRAGVVVDSKYLQST